MDPQLRTVLDQAVATHKAGQLLLAETLYRQVLRQEPNNASVMHLIGLLSHQVGKHAQAVQQIQQALSIAGPVPQFLYNLGNVYRALPDFPRAVECYGQALAQRPDWVEALDNLAATLISLSHFDDALAVTERSLSFRPEGRQAYVNLARIRHDLGMIPEAIAGLRRAHEIDPDYAPVHSNLIYAHYLDPHSTPEQVWQEHARYAERQGELAAAEPSHDQPHRNARDTDRRLRVGYVSSDLRQHPVGVFMEPVLAHHDKSQFEIFVYSDYSGADELSQRIRTHADEWRELNGLPDAKVAKQIRGDQIDLLIDLAGHTTGNRLTLFARKPAPVQASYLGQTATTGLPAVDYLITTENLHLTDLQQTYCTEQLVRIPRSYTCWQPPLTLPDVNDLPALSRGNVTFLSTNNPAKINDEVLRLWSRLLQSLPDSRLIFRVANGPANAAIARRFASMGLPPDRFELVPPMPRDQFLELYHQADVSLDPFPYNGYTTTHESLFMGLPVVTLAGPVLGPSRYGLHLLTAAGHPEWIATSTDDYLRIAIELAADLPRLTSLRSTLRGELQDSPLMDADTVTRALESSYRTMWRTWCERKP